MNVCMFGVQKRCGEWMWMYAWPVIAHTYIIRKAVVLQYCSCFEIFSMCIVHAKYCQYLCHHVVIYIA
jgi:hypothetical protein